MKTLAVAVSICLVISRYALLVQAKDIAERTKLQRGDVFEDGVIQGEKHVHTPVSIREQRDSGSRSDDVRQVSNDTNSEGGDDSGLSDGAIAGIAIGTIGVIAGIICPFVVACYAVTWKEKINAACTHCVERCRRHSKDSSGNTNGQRVRTDTLEDPPGQEMADGNNIRTDGVFGARPSLADLQLIRWEQGGVQKELRITDNIQDKWEKLGNMFGITPAILAGYKQNGQEAAICAVIKKWMETGSKKYPFNWGGFIKALRDIPENTIANELVEALKAGISD